MTDRIITHPQSRLYATEWERIFLTGKENQTDQNVLPSNELIAPTETPQQVKRSSTMGKFDDLEERLSDVQVEILEHKNTLINLASVKAAPEVIGDVQDELDRLEEESDELQAQLLDWDEDSEDAEEVSEDAE